MKVVNAYQLNDFQIVCAENIEDARSWYLRVLNISSEDAFYDFKQREINLDTIMPRYNQSINQLIAENWKGEPFTITVFRK